MKGFPNQVADLSKLALAMRVISGMVSAGGDAKNDDELGEQLVRAGVLGTGHVPIPVDDYLRAQRRKRKSDQSHRTGARGLRELFRLLGFVDDSAVAIRMLPNGAAIAAIAGNALGDEEIKAWRRVINAFEHTDPSGTSHPYQVLLRLVARQPGITRAKCALALEAADDSEGELERIVGLADLNEGQIRRDIGVTQSNWDNAKKILPRFAEQLGDVVKTGQTYVLAEAPGAGADVDPNPDRSTAAVAPPRSSRQVTPDSIAAAGLADRDEPLPPPDLDPGAMAAAIAIRAERLKRHNQMVRAVAGVLSGPNITIYEDPFDILAVGPQHGVLVEVKTLDGTVADERERVRAALAQLLYYEAFVTTPITGNASLLKMAVFEHRPSDAHCAWLNSLDIAVMWKIDAGFAGDALAAKIYQ